MSAEGATQTTGSPSIPQILLVKLNAVSAQQLAVMNRKKE